MHPPQIFVARDGYRRSAQSHPDYDYHQSFAVYENDDFQFEDGIIRHKFKLLNRGRLVGAYCTTKREGSSKPHNVFVELAEYSTGKSLWASKPATMIAKVAEAQCLRLAFQKQFS